ncbi:glycopeptide [Stereum hirsutum FP-91666 SS1]|uniref:glycopeptide n=1 Tax=Stereum hirsutum (strain FP-91666) TaxID=721885 RepID=UPI000440AFBD|nr:glycopeptide [Stereum hirsutum FP-91666 SS1]EIM86539.1 glycopeptide [Stereum hirsutum FP-91666 SS1]
MFAATSILLTAYFALVLSLVQAESHTVSFNNKCGYGTPNLIVNGETLSSGANYTSDGPLSGAIAYLQSGSCGDNGENCTLVETTLLNSIWGSSTDISLISPHKFNEKTSFQYTNGCEDDGATCTDEDCKDAFHAFYETFVQVACTADNVGLEISFC